MSRDLETSPLSYHKLKHKLKLKLKREAEAMSCVLNHAAPDVALTELETGETYSLLELIKRTQMPAVVLFYATWSKACVDEVELFEAWSKNGHDKVANFVLVNLDQNVSETLEFLDQVNPETKRPRVCRDFRYGDAPTVLHFGCADVPEPYAVARVPHKVLIDVDCIVRRNADDFHWDDIAGMLRHRSEEKAAKAADSVVTFLFPKLTA